MVVGRIPESVDLVVVGGGPGGYRAALAAATRGRKVTLIEESAVGGVCLHVGCIPSKALIHAAEIAHAARTSKHLGISAEPSVDMTAFQAWKSSVVGRLAGDVEVQLRRSAVRVVHGRARLTSPTTLTVTDSATERLPGGFTRDATHLEFAHCILAPGSRPMGIQTLPFDGTRVLDSAGALALHRLPDRLVVIGGGYIGVELGTAFTKLGTHVTLVESATRILPEVDAELSDVVVRRLRELGVDVLTGTTATGLDADDVVMSNGARVRADVIVVAVGRRPNTDDLGLESAGVAVAVGPDGRIEVDASRRVLGLPQLFAIGDVTAGPALAHKATAEAEVAAAAACGARTAFDPHCIPAVVFGDPEVLTVGHSLTAAAALCRGTENVISRRSSFRANGRAHTVDRVAGHVRLVAVGMAERPGEARIVGVHAVGAGVSELAGEAALAIELGVSLDDLALTIHAHPTFGESIVDAARN